jgi:hypothetical protein
MEPSPRGDRFGRAVLSAIPDIEAMAMAERFFAIGAEVVGSAHAVAVFLAGCRECLAEWEVHGGARAPLSVRTTLGGVDATRVPTWAR